MGAFLRPNLATVLAAGADGSAINQTNLGNLTFASGSTINVEAHGTMDVVGVTTPANFVLVKSGANSYVVPCYNPA